jgi:hypothetical protein
MDFCGSLGDASASLDAKADLPLGVAAKDEDCRFAYLESLRRA